jgi:uncharacterized protein YjbI with pentapeptide repeats
MLVKIGSLTGNLIISGEYTSIKDCLNQNRQINFSYADLGYADLSDIDLSYIDLSYANLWNVNLSCTDLSYANFIGANLWGTDFIGADLTCADFIGADLMGANFRGTNFRGADLKGVKNYRDIHQIFSEIIRRQNVESFTNKEWAAIAQITLHELCWDSIKKRFSNVIPHIFEILADKGFDEWLNHWNEIK